MLLYETVSQFMQNKPKDFYVDGKVLTESAYVRLSREDRLNNTVECTLNEALTARPFIDDFLKSKMAGVGKDLSKAHTELTNSVRKSAGDITKVKHFKDVLTLIDYSLTTGSNVKDTDGANTGTYVDYANSIRNLLIKMKKNTGEFKKAIQRESVLPEEKRLNTSLYFGLAATVIMLGSECYSNGIHASVDANVTPPMVDHFYFAARPADIAMYKNMVEQLNSIVDRLPDFMNRGLSEEVNEAIDKVTELNEGVLDVVFGLISRSTLLTDILLVPVYLVRFLIYVFKYGVDYVSKLSDSIDESISILKKGTSGRVSVAEFSTYKDTSTARSISLNQAFQRADTALDIESGKDKKNLRNADKSASAGFVL